MAGLRAAQVAVGAQAVAVVTCVGSLSAARIRHAGREAGTRYPGPLEIVSLTGTIDPGHRHLHVALSDGEGRVVGGHLLEGSAVFTPAEIVVVALDDLRFARAPCARSGYDELAIEARRPPG